MLLPEMVGSGAALIDYDNDGDLDVFLVQGYPTGPQGKPLVPVPAGWKPGNRLFRNNLNPSGKLTFTDVTESAGWDTPIRAWAWRPATMITTATPISTSQTTAHNILYHNNGNGTFTDVTASAGVASSGWSTSAAFIDYDRDGLLDLAVVHYVEFLSAGLATCRRVQDSIIAARSRSREQSRSLYHNLGNGRFKNVTDGSRPERRRPGPGLGISTGDFGYGWISGFHGRQRWRGELSVDQRAAQSAIETERSSIQRRGTHHGLAYASDGKPRAGMGIAAGDIYGDGGEAIIVTNLPTEAFTYFNGSRMGNFSMPRSNSGLSHISLPYTRLWRRIVRHGESRTAGYVQRQWGVWLPCDGARIRARSFPTANATVVAQSR